MHKSYEEPAAEHSACRRTFTIYHCKAEDSEGRHMGFSWEFSHREGDICLADHYDIVAKMSIMCTPDMDLNSILNRNFALTNHIEESWTSGSNVVKMFIPQARSTSVGDIIEDDETGDKYIVAGSGFRKLTGSSLNNITVDNTMEVN